MLTGALDPTSSRQHCRLYGPCRSVVPFWAPCCVHQHCDILEAGPHPSVLAQMRKPLSMTATAGSLCLIRSPSPDTVTPQCNLGAQPASELASQLMAARHQSFVTMPALHAAPLPTHCKTHLKFKTQSTSYTNYKLHKVQATTSQQQASSTVSSRRASPSSNSGDL